MDKIEILNVITYNFEHSRLFVLGIEQTGNRRPT